MAELPENFIESPTVLAIYEAYKKAERQRFSRRLGASFIGMECPRAIWYAFRWASREEFDGRILRLFETGNIEESRFVANLRAIGCEVVDRDPETGQQIEYSGVGGHLVVKLDAVLCGVTEAPKTWHTGEFKTHSAKSFADLRKNGLKKSKPQHYAQCVIGMVLSGLDRCLYLAVNKDTDELYAERVRLDKEEGQKLLEFASQIVEASRAPERISEDRTKLPCKFCSFSSVCFGSSSPNPGVTANVNCRTCCHATPLTDGSLGNWRCERHSRVISEPEQKRACEDHLFIPDFITFANVTDGGEESGIAYVEYTNTDGKSWRNSKRSGDYKSVELVQLPSQLVGAGYVDSVKQELGGEVVEVEK